MRSVLTIVISGTFLFNSGCNLINPKENIPTYVRINSFDFVPKDPSKEGSASQKITSAWVYFNNQSLGTFQLPANVPIITDGPGELNVVPGISYNGLSNEAQYPFFTSYTTSIAVAQGKVIEMTPKIGYVEGAKFQKEDFDLGSGFIEVNSEKAEDTNIVWITDNRVFEGKGSGYIKLDAKHPSSETIYNTGFPIPQGNAFLELNYKCTTSFVVGLQTLVSGNIVAEYFGGVKPKSNWNKIYIDLSTFTAANKGSEYRLMIKATLDSGLSEGEVLLDNIKVISF